MVAYESAASFGVGGETLVLADLAVKSAVISGAGLLTIHLLRRASSATRHVVGMAGVVALIALPALTLSLPRWQVFSWRAPEVITSGDRAESSADRSDGAPTAAAADSPQRATESPNRDADHRIASGRLSTGGEDNSPGIISVSVALGFIWCAGTIYCLARLAVAVLRVRHWIRASRPIQEGRWLELAEQIAGELKLSIVPRLVRSPDALVPFTFGLGRPVVVLPPQADDWRDVDRRLVLCHELGHLKRKDCLWQWLGELARAQYWFNPLVWLLAERLRRDREEACDDLVVRHNANGADYASLLLKMARQLRPTAFQPVAISMATRADVAHRIDAILAPGRNRLPATRRLVAGACIVAIAALVPLAMCQAGKAQQEKSPAQIAPAEPVASEKATPSKGRPTGKHLEFLGSLFIDPSRLANVRLGFPGDVTSIGPMKPGADPATDPAGGRPLRFGDRVVAGQVLAVCWSKSVGEEKSRLVEAQSQYAQSRAELDRLKLLPPGTIDVVKVREWQRAVEADIIAVERCEHQFRASGMTTEGLKRINDEAEGVGRGDRESNARLKSSWDELEVRAPFAGVILERNINQGDIVEAMSPLFRVADLSQLGVRASVGESDLPALESLTPEQRQWTIHPKNQSLGVPGNFDLNDAIVIDPHTGSAAVTGLVKNVDGRLRPGQFITATIELPPTANDR